MAIDNKDKKVLNVPHLRFPEFTEEWVNVSLKDVADFQKERISSGLLDESTYISTENILQNFQGVQSAISIPANTNVVAYKKNDILLSNIRPYLKKVWFSDRIGGCSADVFVLRSKTCEPEFLYNVIASDKFINYVMSGAKGVKMPRGDKNQMESFSFSIPAVVEQRKISRLFQLLDERIVTQNKIIEKLQSLIKGLNDNIHKGIKGETVCFSDLGEAYSGLSGKGGDDFGYGEPFITYMNVYQNTYISEKDYELVQIAPNEKQNSVQYGDALFTLSSETPEEVGIGAVYLGNTQKLYLNSFCFGIHFYDERVLPQYLAHFISSSSFRRAIYPLAQGSTRFNLQKNDFMKMKFLLPSLEKQGHIANTLDALHCRLANEKSLTEQYILLKKYLLSLMFI
ncbi:restriction endonuclease subunit S [Parabacteroides distasonis]|uniref:restriction endonuclease subunit S n=1 Tax=Bacteroidales TaxID=171549 RepID=UPI001E351A63|nr:MULTISPECIES: restriction endonuclease subunit S [Bacteroidales]MDB9149154.1 restriction endonuclease subunit S [Parabacteroides distasonis]